MYHRVWVLDRKGDNIACKSVNNALGFELTDYVINPRFIEEKLNEELDTAQITLEGYPKAKCFSPKTKFIIERWDNHGNLLPPYFHMILQNDNVEAYVGLSDYYTHRLDLVEASAIAQGYHVDNIAVTYELQDIDLNYDLDIDTDSNAACVAYYNDEWNERNDSEDKAPFWTREITESWSYASAFGSMKEYIPPFWTQLHGTVKWNRDEGGYGPIKGVRSYKFIVEGNYGDIRNNYVSEVGEPNTIIITIPKFRCYRAVENNATFTGTYYTLAGIPFSDANQGYHREYAYGTWEPWTYCETITTITIKDATTGSVVETKTHICKPQSATEIYQEYYAKDDRYEENNNWGEAAYIIPLYWERAKEKIKLCSVSNGEGATLELELDGNKIYQVETYLNTKDGQGATYSKVAVNMEHRVPITGVKNSVTFTLEKCSYDKPYSKISFETSPDMILSATPILRRPAKYNLLDCLKKAVLSTGAYHKKDGIAVLNTPTSFVIDPSYSSKLELTPIHETIFYENNLWEVCSSIGYYIHAIPYIEFFSNEQFLISFRELGKNTLSPVENKKITVFNSRDIEEYFGALDSYVKNFYSPENVIDERIPFKTVSEDYLITNESVCGQTSERILQVKEFYIGNGDGVEANALSFIVEKSIYDTFSLDYDRVPSKANTIYYSLDTNRIQGMTTNIPATNNTDKIPLYPIQALIGRLFGITTSHYNIKVNDYYMHIVYNTADTTRIKQVRPNINELLLNSTFDQYPVHEQFYGQESKIIDSERYGNLLYGELLKTGNEYYQSDEWNELGAVKEVGDISMINGVPYYISQVESEWYDNAIFQKITYHKDFNAISKIISIPSEPRFYEVANVSLIDRLPYSFENILISTAPTGTNPTGLKGNPKYIVTERFCDSIKGWLLGVNPIYPDYAVTTFRDDPDTHGDKYKQLFVDTPKIEMTGTQILTDKVITQNKILVYSSQNSLVFEWGMEDNYSSGSFVAKINKGDVTDGAYYGLNFLRYCDLYGRADIMDFALINNDVNGIENIRKLPQKICSDSAIENAAVRDVGRILNKDNRESLKSISFQVNLITDENIYFGRAIWRKKEMPVKVLLLSREISKFSFQNLYDDKQAQVLAEVAVTPVSGITEDGFVYVELPLTIPDEIINEVACIAIVDGGDGENTKGGMPYIYRNVVKLPPEQKRHSFFITIG